MVESYINKNGWLIVLPAIFLFCQAPAVAQQQQEENKPPPIRKFDNNNEYVAEHLKQPPDLPYLPPYPNNPEYTSVLNWKRLKDGPAYSATFQVKDGPDDVLQYYKETLKKHEWRMIPANCQGHMLAATRDKPSATVTIMAMRPIKKGTQCQVYMTYKIYGKE